jgi:hypothetical protein
MPSEILEIHYSCFEEEKKPCSSSGYLNVPLRVFIYPLCVRVLFDHLRISCQGLTCRFLMALPWLARH